MEEKKEEKKQVIWESSNGDKWLRQGECVSCGMCCKVLTIAATMPRDIAKLMDAHGIPRNERGDHVFSQNVNHLCEKLGYKSEDKKHYCCDYDKRPDVCRTFPMMPGQSYAEQPNGSWQRHQTCGYFWIKEDTKEDFGDYMKKKRLELIKEKLNKGVKNES